MTATVERGRSGVQATGEIPGLNEYFQLQGGLTQHFASHWQKYLAQGFAPSSLADPSLLADQLNRAYLVAAQAADEFLSPNGGYLSVFGAHEPADRLAAIVERVRDHEWDARSQVWLDKVLLPAAETGTVNPDEARLWASVASEDTQRTLAEQAISAYGVSQALHRDAGTKREKREAAYEAILTAATQTLDPTDPVRAAAEVAKGTAVVVNKLRRDEAVLDGDLTAVQTARETMRGGELLSPSQRTLLENLSLPLREIHSNAKSRAQGDGSTDQVRAKRAEQALHSLGIRRQLRRPVDAAAAIPVVVSSPASSIDTTSKPDTVSLIIDKAGHVSGLRRIARAVSIIIPGAVGVGILGEQAAAAQPAMHSSAPVASASHIVQQATPNLGGLQVGKELPTRVTQPAAQTTATPPGAEMDGLVLDSFAAPQTATKPMADVMSGLVPSGTDMTPAAPVVSEPIGATATERTAQDTMADLTVTDDAVTAQLSASMVSKADVAAQPNQTDQAPTDNGVASFIGTVATNNDAAPAPQKAIPVAPPVTGDKAAPATAVKTVAATGAATETAPTNNVDPAMVATTLNKYQELLKNNNVDFMTVVSAYQDWVSAQGKNFDNAETPKFIADIQQKAELLYQTAISPSSGLDDGRRAAMKDYLVKAYITALNPEIVSDDMLGASFQLPNTIDPEFGIYAQAKYSKYMNADDGAIAQAENIADATVTTAIDQLTYADASMLDAPGRLSDLQQFYPDSYKASLAASATFQQQQAAKAAAAKAGHASDRQDLDSGDAADGSQPNQAPSTNKHEFGKLPEHLTAQQRNIRIADEMIKLGGKYRNRGLILKALFQAGVTNPDGANGAVGGLMGESFELNPRRVQGGPDSLYMPDSVKDGKGGFGWMQITYPALQDQLLDIAHELKMPEGTMQVQITFMLRKLEQYPTLIDKLNAAKSPEQAAVIWTKIFERPDPAKAHLDRRQGYAHNNAVDWNHFGKELDLELAQQHKPTQAAPTDTVLAHRKQLVQIGLSFANPMNAPENIYNPDPDYSKELKALGGAKSERGADCAEFVGSIFLKSGLVPNFPEMGTWNQYGYMKDHPNLFQWKGLLKSEKQLKPGDVLSIGRRHGMGGGGHIAMYIGNGKVVMASLGDFQPKIAGLWGFFHDSRGKYDIFSFNH